MNNQHHEQPAATLSLPKQAAELRFLKQEADGLAAQAAGAKAFAVEAEHRFFERLEEEGVDSIKVGGTNFVKAETSYGQVQDRAAFIAWCEENKPELVELKERKALVNELVREHLDDGSELPPGLGFYVKQYVSQRAA